MLFKTEGVLSFKIVIVMRKQLCKTLFKIFLLCLCLQSMNRQKAKSQEEGRRGLQAAHLVQGDREDFFEMICKIPVIPARSLEGGTLTDCFMKQLS